MSSNSGCTRTPRLRSESILSWIALRCPPQINQAVTIGRNLLFQSCRVLVCKELVGTVESGLPCCQSPGHQCVIIRISRYLPLFRYGTYRMVCTKFDYNMYHIGFGIFLLFKEGYENRSTPDRYGCPARGPSQRSADSAGHSEGRADLVLEIGFKVMSIDAVAVRAGVGRMTIYRRWPNKAAIVMDAFVARVGPWYALYSREKLPR